MNGPPSRAWSDEFLNAGPPPGTEIGPDGWPIGRDPRRMAPEELRALGHEPMAATAAIRAHCLDCCAGSADEVRKCIATCCPSWPWRMGLNPWRTVSEGRREAGRRLAAQRAEKAAASKSDLSADAGTPGPVHSPTPEVADAL